MIFPILLLREIGEIEFVRSAPIEEENLMALVARQSVTVVFPAFNEEENLPGLLDETMFFLSSLFSDWEIIVVNDGSLDRTREIIDSYSQKHPNIIALHHDYNHGYGAALKTGITHSRKDLVFFCDADLQFHISEILLLLIWIESADIVIGYRLKRADPFLRRMNALGWNMLVRFVLGLKVKDIDCAFKLFRRVVFQGIKIDAVGAMVNTDILVQASRMGFRIKQVPVTHFPRLEGEQSGANVKVILKAMRELFSLRRKLRTVQPIVFERFTPERRAKGRSNPRLWQRVSSDALPLNSPDVGNRYMRLSDTKVVPIYSFNRDVNMAALEIERETTMQDRRGGATGPTQIED